MLQTRKISDKKGSHVAVAWEPTEIYLRNAGKENFGTEETLAMIRDETAFFYPGVAEKYGLEVHIDYKVTDVTPLREVLKRYRIEPRAAYGCSSRTWVVVFDKKVERYVSEDGRYLRFDNSDEALDYLIKSLTSPEPKTTSDDERGEEAI